MRTSHNTEASTQPPEIKEFRVFVVAIDQVTPEKFRATLQAKVIMNGETTAIGREVGFFLNDIMLGAAACDKWGRANITIEVTWLLLTYGNTLTAQLEGLDATVTMALPLPERPKTSAEIEKEERERQEKISQEKRKRFVAELERYMVDIPAGTFEMGQNDEEQRLLKQWGWWNDYFYNECPRHAVKLSEFSMSRYPVTQAQWDAIMGTAPSNFKGMHLPVERISWNDAQDFCLRLSEETGKMYRLPTEAEWEYACRAGSSDIWCFGSDPTILSQYAWFSENAENQTHPVGQLQPNAWGLFDMHGNVWEWCQDAYISDVYATLHTQSPAVNPMYASGGSMRVIRGGSWYNFPARVRASGRNYGGPAHPYHDVGFRIVRTN